VSGSGPRQTALACLDGLLGSVVGRRVVDVACGQGIASRRLAERGATVVGVDSSPPMLANARRHGTPVGAAITWIEADAQSLAPLADRSFDAAVCQLALMDIPDLDAALAAIARVLRRATTTARSAPT
jgi:ubiquinone/menaquinone biosynthesis C-methylase UbiE